MSKIPVAVNFHLWKPCNLRCRFCFAVFDDVPGRLNQRECEQLITMLAEAGCEKLTFVGGEPTLCPFLGELLVAARARTLTTCVVTNGARLAPLLDRYSGAIDWIGLSVDSASEEIQAKLGRGDGDHVTLSVAHAARVRASGIRLKLNTVVTALNHHEDMSTLVRTIRPERWKVFQVLPVAGQNDGCGDLLITPEQFQGYIDRHVTLAAEGLAPVAEDNDAMRGSYVMIDPLGRFFDNVDEHYVYGPSILASGVEPALAATRWERERLAARGGLYAWRRSPSR